MKKQNRRYKFNDPLIVPRVKNYLAENVDKTFVDVGQMARSLKDRYREYNSRPENAFCQMVEAAYKVVLESYGLNDASSSDGSEDSDDLEMLEDGNRVLNDQLLALYQRQDKKSHKDQADKSEELIAISSEDSDAAEEAEKAPKVQKLNDQVTITPHIPDAVRHIERLAERNVDRHAERHVERHAEPVIDKPRNKEKYSDRKRKSDANKSVNLKRKPLENIIPQTISKVSFEQFGGISEILGQICDLIIHMKHPEVYKQLGVAAPRGALLHGPPGTGKTLLAHAIAGKLRLPLMAAPATELVGGVSGESEARIRELFEKATAAQPCIIFIDEIDAICGNRLNAQKDMERRMVAQLLASIDQLNQDQAAVLVLAATNNADSLDPALRRAGRLEQEIALGIPSVAARREILQIICSNISLSPDVEFRALAQITPGFVGADLQALVNKACTVAIKRVFKFLKSVKQDTLPPAIMTTQLQPEEAKLANGENDIESSNTEEIVPQKNGELVAPEKLEENHDKSNEEAVPQIQSTVAEENIVTETKNIEVEKTNQVNVITPSDPISDMLYYLENTEAYTPEQLSGMTVSQSDFLLALKTTKPSAIREGIATVPDVTWSDIGSLQNVRQELQLAVLAPVKYPEQLETLGLSVPSGVLLCGPPGCGKTLLAKAIANEAGVNFISVKGPELLNMYVGESERAVRTCFQRARNSAPCVIFFDEFDSLCPKRAQGDNSGATRVVNQLLTEMDGVESRQGVFVLAASNRPDIIDPAVLRPGRLDRVIYVGMPNKTDRLDILNTITRKGMKPVLRDVDLVKLAGVTEGFTGADLAGLVRQAATQALTQYIADGATSDVIYVEPQHFEAAVSRCRPSVSHKEQQHYEKLRIKYASASELDEVMETASVNEESMDTV